MAKNGKQKIILDTNIWVSYSIGKSLTSLEQLLLHPNLTFYYSEQIIYEYLNVVQRAKFNKYISKQRIADTLDLISSVCSKFTVSSNVILSRDVKDNFLLALAKDLSADFLVTGDKDLLVIKKFHNTKIVTYTDFVELIKRDF